MHHKKGKSDTDIYNVSDGSGVPERGWGGAMSKKIICHFFKRGHREVEKTFNQVFFMLLYIIIYTKLTNFA